MTSVTIFQGESLDYYELTIEWINQQYDSYPTSLVHIPLSETELSEMSYYDALGRYCAVEAREAHPCHSRRGRQRSEPTDHRRLRRRG